MRIVRDVMLYGLLMTLLLVIASVYISGRISQPLEKLARLTGSGTTERLTGRMSEVKIWYREADRLKKECRTQDIISRFGGEEFVIFFPSTTLSEAWSVADRVREKIASMPFPR